MGPRTTERLVGTWGRGLHLPVVQPHTGQGPRSLGLWERGGRGLAWALAGLQRGHAADGKAEMSAHFQGARDGLKVVGYRLFSSFMGLLPFLFCDYPLPDASVLFLILSTMHFLLSGVQS